MNLLHNKANSHSALTCAPDLINEETNHESDIIYCLFSNNTIENQELLTDTLSQVVTLHSNFTYLLGTFSKLKFLKNRVRMAMF